MCPRISIPTLHEARAFQPRTRQEITYDPTFSPLVTILPLRIYILHGYNPPTLACVPFLRAAYTPPSSRRTTRNYLRFSANAINQKRRSASPAGPSRPEGAAATAAAAAAASPSAFDSTRLDSTRLRATIDNSRLIRYERERERERESRSHLSAPRGRLYGKFHGRS